MEVGTLYEAARAALNAWEHDSNECRWHMGNLRAALDAAARPAERDEPVAWHVCSVNSDGSLSLEFAAPWEELAHEHISDAILDDIDGAGAWVVRPVYATPKPIATEPTPSTPSQVQVPLTEFKRMQIISDEFPLALVEPIVIAKVDSVCLAIEKAHGIGA